MASWKTVSLPSEITDEIDKLVDKGTYTSRAEYIRELVRKDIRQRDQS